MEVAGRRHVDRRASECISGSFPRSSDQGAGGRLRHAARRSGARSHGIDRGPLRDHAACRHGRRGPQDRTSGNRRRHAFLGPAVPRWRGAVVPKRQSQQVVRRARLHFGGRPRRAEWADQSLRRRRRQSPSRLGEEVQGGRGELAGDQAGPDLCVDHRLRPGGRARRLGLLRPDCRGLFRRDGPHGRNRRGPTKDRRPGRRHAGG